MCCMRLAENTRRKKSPKIYHLGTIAQLCRAVSKLGHVSTFDNLKNLLNSNISSSCPHNIANFGPLAAEICWWVWGTPANFNGFRILAALLHGTLVVGVSQTVALNRGRHLYSAGRPSHWTLAHILVDLFSLYVPKIIVFDTCIHASITMTSIVTSKNERWHHSIWLILHTLYFFSVTPHWAR